MEEARLLKDALERYETYLELLKTQPIDSDSEPIDFQRFFKYYLEVRRVNATSNI